MSPIRNPRHEDQGKSRDVIKRQCDQDHVAFLRHDVRGHALRLIGVGQYSLMAQFRAFAAPGGAAGILKKRGIARIDILGISRDIHTGTAAFAHNQSLSHGGVGAKHCRNGFLDPFQNKAKEHFFQWRKEIQQGQGYDLAHLGIALCRSISIPARMVVGYLHGLEPMDLHAWFEAYVGDRWYTFDPSQQELRGGRIAIAYGRDAADVSIFHQFGPLPTYSGMNVKVELISN